MRTQRGSTRSQEDMELKQLHEDTIVAEYEGQEARCLGLNVG